MSFSNIPGRPHLIHVPGHTPGEVALFLLVRGVLLSGDTLETRNLYTGEEGRPMIPGRYLNTNDKLALRSINSTELIFGLARELALRIE